MDHVIGQQRAIEMLQSALRSDRLHHAFVFHGPSGVGKFTTAVAFARLLLCHDRQADLAKFRAGLQLPLFGLPCQAPQ